MSEQHSASSGTNRPVSPSFGWIQAFLCMAEHLDYDQAGKLLGISARRAQRRVANLESWLHKALIFDDPIELDVDYGPQFISIASEIFLKIEAACIDVKSHEVGSYSTRIAKNISKIRLYDFERFLAVSNTKSYKAAADDMGCDVTSVQRSAQSLERLTGRQFFAGRSLLEILPDGEIFTGVARDIVDAMYGFRAKIPEDYDPVNASIQSISDEITIREAQLKAIAHIVSGTGKNQRGRIRLTEVEERLEIISKLNMRILEIHDPISKISASDIKIK